jgi:hypothetical protein
MTVYAEYKVIAATMASATTTSSEVDLGGTGYEHVYLQIPASPGGDTRVFVARELGGTYVRIGGTSLHNVASSISNCMVRLTDRGRFMKVVSTTAPANGATYYFICYS